MGLARVLARSLTPPERLDRRARSLLALLGATALVNEYDFGIQVLALPQIQQGLAIPESELARVIAVMRLGMAPAILLAWWADRVGRRRLLLATILGFTACTVATAFARTPEQFMWLQFTARVFLTAEDVLAVVVLTEELSARSRGYGIGVLAACGALGHGVASLLFSQVGVLPYGWRALYVVGAVPLLLLAWYRRNLRETARFEHERAARGDDRGWRAAARPLLALARMYPGRLAALATALLPWAFVIASALTFQSKLLQQEHGWSPGQVAMLYLGGGALAVLGNLVAGSLGDRLGRKPVLIGGVVLFGIGAFWFYGATGAALPAAWVVMMSGSFGAGVLFGALGGELFPTSYRSTASAARTLLVSAGAALGLWSEALLYELLGSHPAAIRAMLAVLVIPPLVVALFVPETARRELEEISPERDERMRGRSTSARTGELHPIPVEARSLEGSRD